MKNPLIEVKINSIRTYQLIADIKTFSINHALEAVSLNEYDICEQIERELPELIPVDTLMATYEMNDQETHQVLLFLAKEAGR